jgi:beta-glucosidase
MNFLVTSNFQQKILKKPATRVAETAWILILSAGVTFAQRQARPQPVTGPWMDKSLSADARADLLVQAMTLDEKIGLVNGGRGGFGGPGATATPTRSVGGAGFIAGIERLGIPDLQMADSAVGVVRSARYGRYSTALPSTLAASATWDPVMASSYGALIGQELRDQGYTMSLGGGVNITRESRNGRNFEYNGEDPILAGTMVGELMKGMQSVHMITDIKHYAVNDQETGRNIVNAVLDERTLRESDLLAFEIGLHISKASAVMCGYNKVNGDWDCENKYLLTDVLKNTWGFKGWVLSDWGGTHSTEKAALAGLDQEMPGSTYFGEKLKQAVTDGTVPTARLDDMVHRIVRSMISSGIFDDPPQQTVPNPFAGFAVARKVAEQSIVLLKNNGGVLPLDSSKAHHVLLIGSHADVGVLSGGGSAQVDPPGGNPVAPPANTATTGVAGSFTARGSVWMPSSPLKFLQEQMPQAQVEYDPGTDVAAAVRKAAKADVAIVFVNQPMSEGRDGDLALPDNQDALVSAVAGANKNTVVVLETGGPVLMPWSDKAAAIVAAWFPGIAGGQAIAEVLTGAVNPSGKLSVTFPRSIDDLPHHDIFGLSLVQAQQQQPRPALTPGATAAAPAGGARQGLPPFDAPYTEGLQVGYKWYDAQKKAPLFAFGYGLSYTTYRYGNAKATQGNGIQVSFAVKNTGKRMGTEISEVYLAMPQSTGEPPKRLIGWSRTELGPGEEKNVTITVDPHYCAIFNTEKHEWEVVAGDYQVMIGGSSSDLPLKQEIHLESAFLPPMSAN